MSFADKLRRMNEQASADVAAFREREDLLDNCAPEILAVVETSDVLVGAMAAWEEAVSDRDDETASPETKAERVLAAHEALMAMNAAWRTAYHALNALNAKAEEMK